MTKTTKEIRRSEMLLRDGDTLWYSQSDVDQLRKELLVLIERDYQYQSGHMKKLIDEVFDKFSQSKVKGN